MFASAAAAAAAARCTCSRAATCPRPRPRRAPRRGCGQDRAERKVAARDALRAGQDVGLEAEARGGEPVAAAAEPRDDLVGHEQDARVTADRANGFQVALGRREHAARADHRLAEERRDPLGPTSSIAAGGSPGSPTAPR